MSQSMKQAYSTLLWGASLAVLILSSHAACPGSFKLRPADGLCYEHVTTARDFRTAELDCRSRGEGGTLAKVVDDGLSAWEKPSGVVPFNGVTVDFKTWIGVNDIEDNGRYSYNDGSPLTTYQPWDTPVNGHGGVAAEGCIIWKARPSYAWSDLDCAEKMQYICQVPQDAALPLKLRTRRMVENPAASTNKWSIISTHKARNNLHCGLMCTEEAGCAGVMVDGVSAASPDVLCSLLQPDKLATLSVPLSATLYEWVVA